jgi:hypothetical protein
VVEQLAGFRYQVGMGFALTFGFEELDWKGIRSMIPLSFGYLLSFTGTGQSNLISHVPLPSPSLNHR